MLVLEVMMAERLVTFYCLACLLIQNSMCRLAMALVDRRFDRSLFCDRRGDASQATVIPKFLVKA